MKPESTDKNHAEVAVFADSAGGCHILMSKWCYIMDISSYISIILKAIYSLILSEWLTVTQMQLPPSLQALQTESICQFERDMGTFLNILI